MLVPWRVIAFYDLPRILKISMFFWYQTGLSAEKDILKAWYQMQENQEMGCIQDPLEFLTQLDTVLICSSGFRRSLNFMR